MLSNSNLTNEHWIIVAVGYIIVFASLCLLYLVFENLPVLLTLAGKKQGKQKNMPEEPKVQSNLPSPVSGDEIAAISAAIFLFKEELHDEETAVITIRKITKKYSPWSSKIYNVINGLNKRF
jgi:glutaconyl-CoA/methylmalonyl-CoA decarboxylase subunit delta